MNVFCCHEHEDNFLRGQDTFLRGSFLRPLLFRIFLNDLQSVSDAADDCTLTVVTDSIIDLKNKLNSDFELIQI